MKKRCPICGEVKAHKDFYKNRSAPDGLNTYCRPCTSIYQKEAKKRLKTKGKTYTGWIAGHSPKLYNAWRGMKARCRGDREEYRRLYTDRGIVVCARWDKSFLEFAKDMGEPPSKNYSLDRIDTDGNYTPKNCRWASSSQQQRNRRDNAFSQKDVDIIRYLRSRGNSLVLIATCFNTSPSSIGHICNGNSWKDR